MTLRPFAAPGTPARWVRPRSFRLSHLALDITIDLDAQRVEGTVAHRVEFLPHGEGRTTIELDQEDLAIAAVAVDGREARWSLAPGRLLVAVPDCTGDACTVTVRFSSERPAKGLIFVPAGPDTVAMAWTQGAMEDHHHWFPCWDDPNNLCTFQVAVRHRAQFQAIANGDRSGRVEHGDGWATTTYVQPRAHVLYLLNLVVGDLVEVVDPGGPVPIAHWLPRGHQDKALAMFRATDFAIRWLGEFTGTPFPWTRYGHAVVHRFLWGGMENTTLTTITDRVLMDAATQERDDLDCDALVIHELVHQWYGDLMTMKGWSDIWLNESFATWLEARCSAAWRAEREGVAPAAELARALWANRAAYLAEDGGRYRRALVTNRWDDAYELFDRVAYEKGSLVLELLAGQLGEPRLRAAVALYTRRHAHGLVETADWRRALEDATGEPLDWWFDQWVMRAGHPLLKVRYQHDPRRGVLSVTVEQTHEGEPWRLALELAWAGGGSARLTVDQARTSVVLPCPLAPAWVAADPADRLPA
ncbi:MAG: M1 family metallopeptidase, partial [Planctomycetes bacterium]|nr:M1 family metallopeptidase [Planctomycetota bacterium]